MASSLNHNLDLSFVIITYNDAAKLPKAISSASLSAVCSGLEYEILVVDNGSTDHTRQVLESFQDVLGGRLRVDYLGRNTGTTYSRNLAFRQAGGNYLCVMDSDAELLDQDISPVLNLLDELPEAGLVGPRIIMPDGSTYNSAKRLPTLLDKLAKLPQILLGSPPHNYDWYPDFPFERPRTVETAISCCWFLRRDLLESVGLLDERIFYAPEDVDYCLRCWKNGRAVVYYPYFRVLHHTKQVTHKKPLSLTALSHFKGLLYYLGKHGYCFSRGNIVERWVTPLAARLDPLLEYWEK